MGRIRYRYNFERAPTVEEVAERFRSRTGLDMSARAIGGTWLLRAAPLRGEVEVSYEGNALWVIPSYERWLGGRYFLEAFNLTLRDLGDKRTRRRRVPEYALRRWEDLPSWQRWLHR